MEVIINGESKDVPTEISAAQLLELMGFTGRRVAMEVNREIVPRSRFEAHRFQPGDRIEIVHAIGGGSAPSRPAAAADTTD